MLTVQTAGVVTLLWGTSGPKGSGMENTFMAQAYDLDDEWGCVFAPLQYHFATPFHLITNIRRFHPAVAHVHQFQHP
jgi:hypothetical protein